MSQPGLEPYKGGYYLWNYVPSIPASVIFMLLFLATSALHSWRTFTTGTRFCWVFTLGCLCEVIGFIARAAAANKTGHLMPYILQNFYLLVAPALFAASIYITLGQIMRCIKGEKYSTIRIHWITRAFVLGDILSFAVQGSSAGLMFKPSTLKLGEDLVIIGLFIQLVSFGLFFMTAIIFERRINRSPTAESLNTTAPWRQTLHILYGVSILILIRSIFRIIEYIQGQSGYSLKHEWTLYIFDSLPMFVVTVIFFHWFPSRERLPEPGAEDFGI